MKKYILFMFTLILMALAFVMPISAIFEDFETDKRLNSPDLTVETIDDSSLELSWEAVEYASKYHIFRSLVKDGEYTLIKSTSKFNFKDKNLKSGTTYYYCIISQGKIDKKTVYSHNSKTAKGKTASFNAPTLSFKFSYVTKIDLQWNSINDAKSYDIYRSLKSDGTYIKIASTIDTTYLDTGLNEDTTYYYKFKSIKKNNESNFSKVHSVKTSKSQKQMTIDEFIKYLNKNFSSVDTPMGTVSMTHNYIYNDQDHWPWDYWIQTDYSDISPYDIQHSIKYTKEQKQETINILSLIQLRICFAADIYLTDKKIEGGFYHSWYKYYYIQAGYEKFSFLTWNNFKFKNGEYSFYYYDTNLSRFNWYNMLDDFKFNTLSFKELVDRL